MATTLKTRSKVGIGSVITAAILSVVYLLAFDEVILVEGGYANHPNDPGGRTMYGITEEVARRHGYHGEMRLLTEDFARNVYYKDYWQAQRLDDVALVYDELARQLFDVGVNLGVGRSGTYLQRCLNSLNQRGRFYRDLGVDGRIGPATLDALGRFGRWRGSEGEEALMTCVSGLQTVHYLTLSERSGKFESFTYGWYHRVRRKAE